MEEEDCIKPPKSGLCGWGCGYGVVVVGRYSSESRMELRVSVRFFWKINDASARVKTAKTIGKITRDMTSIRLAREGNLDRSEWAVQQKITGRITGG